MCPKMRRSRYDRETKPTTSQRSVEGEQERPEKSFVSVDFGMCVTDRIYSGDNRRDKGRFICTGGQL